MEFIALSIRINYMYVVLYYNDTPFLLEALTVSCIFIINGPTRMHLDICVNTLRSRS